MEETKMENDYGIIEIFDNPNGDTPYQVKITQNKSIREFVQDFSVSERTENEEAPHSQDSNTMANILIDSVQGAVGMTKKVTPTKTRKKSMIWKFFTPLNQSDAFCNTCERQFGYRSSITNLKRHLQRKHKNKMKEFWRERSGSPGYDEVEDEDNQTGDTEEIMQEDDVFPILEKYKNEGMVDASLDHVYHKSEGHLTKPVSLVKLKKTSKLWEFFTPLSSTEASCNTCKKRFIYKSTITNLKRHLTRKHPNKAVQRFNTSYSGGDDVVIIEETEMVKSAAEASDSEKGWTPKATFLLLRLKKELEHIFRDAQQGGKVRLWNQIADKMTLDGFEVTGDECNEKWRRMKRWFKSLELKRLSSPSAVVRWRYYDAIAEILASNPPDADQTDNDMVVENEFDNEVSEYGSKTQNEHQPARSPRKTPIIRFSEKSPTIRKEFQYRERTPITKRRMDSRPFDVFAASIVSELLKKNQTTSELSRDLSCDFEERLRRLEKAEQKFAEREKERESRQKQLIKHLEAANKLEERKIKMLETYLELYKKQLDS